MLKFLRFWKNKSTEILGVAPNPGRSGLRTNTRRFSRKTDAHSWLAYGYRSSAYDIAGWAILSFDWLILILSNLTTLSYKYTIFRISWKVYACSTETSRESWARSCPSSLSKKPWCGWLNVDATGRLFVFEKLPPLKRTVLGTRKNPTNSVGGERQTGRRGAFVRFEENARRSVLWSGRFEFCRSLRIFCTSDQHFSSWSSVIWKCEKFIDKNLCSSKTKCFLSNGFTRKYPIFSGPWSLHCPARQSARLHRQMHFAGRSIHRRGTRPGNRQVSRQKRPEGSTRRVVLILVFIFRVFFLSFLALYE